MTIKMILIHINNSINNEDNKIITLPEDASINDMNTGDHYVEETPRNTSDDPQTETDSQSRKMTQTTLTPWTVVRYTNYLNLTETIGITKIGQTAKWPFKTVAMFTDVSEFTELSEMLADGAEKVIFYFYIKGVKIISQIFYKLLIKHVRAQGAHVFRFAGDGIIVAWPAAVINRA